MIEIDGSSHSGSGTLLRYAVALATIKGEPLHISRIRAKRPKPGLRPQHLSAVKACATLSGGIIEGGDVGSQELVYRPEHAPAGGQYHFNIGTAGSATMAAFTLLPPALFSAEPSRITITGGLFQDFAPTFFHMERVLVPMIRRMGAEVSLEMLRPGYVPKGQGKLRLDVRPCAGLESFRLTRQGKVRSVQGISLSSNLHERFVSRRMADRCVERLRQSGYSCRIDVREDTEAVQRGAALFAWAETDSGCFLGADRAGKPGRRSEDIADFVARSLVEDLKSGACADRHLADQLILFAALARGTTEYRAPAISDHIRANLWLVEEVLGVRTENRGQVLRIRGIGWQPVNTDDL
jgi:RNA 3'-terminal phosphate cyclase (ATP)